MRESSQQEIFAAVSQKEIYIFLPVMALIYFVVEAAVDERRAVAALAFVTVIMGTTRICWPLRHRAWFWVTMAVISTMHFAAIVFVPWSETRVADLLGIELVPIMAIDFALVFAIIWSMNRLVQWVRG